MDERIGDYALIDLGASENRLTFARLSLLKVFGAHRSPLLPDGEFVQCLIFA
jgi:hypothetical protein